MSSISKVKMENGVYLFKLNNILKDKNISINKISRDTNTDFKVIKRLMTGELVKIDIFVLSRVCDYLDCTIEDIAGEHWSSAVEEIARKFPLIRALLYSENREVKDKTIFIYSGTPALVNHANNKKAPALATL